MRKVSDFKTGYQPDASLLLTQCFTPNQQSAALVLREFMPSFNLEFAKSTYCLDISCTIIIPFRDKWNLTKACLNSLLKQNLAGLSIQVVLVDNGSTEIALFKELSEYFLDSRVQWHLEKQNEPFNFSRLNNNGVRKASAFISEFLIFVNNDIEFKNENTLREMLLFKKNMGNKAGAVGCTLLYPNQTLQHLFLAPGIKIVAGHPMKGMSYNPHSEWFKLPRPVPAVTGALLCVSRTQFESVGGFDEQLATAYQDLDLCLKLQKYYVAQGQSNWVLPHLVCVHHENATRPARHNWSEVRLMYERWGDDLDANAGMASILSCESEIPTLKLFCRLPA